MSTMPKSSRFTSDQVEEIERIVDYALYNRSEPVDEQDKIFRELTSPTRTVHGPCWIADHVCPDVIKLVHVNDGECFAAKTPFGKGDTELEALMSLQLAERAQSEPNPARILDERGHVVTFDPKSFNEICFNAHWDPRYGPRAVVELADGRRVSIVMDHETYPMTERYDVQPIWRDPTYERTGLTPGEVMAFLVELKDGLAVDKAPEPVEETPKLVDPAPGVHFWQWEDGVAREYVWGRQFTSVLWKCTGVCASLANGKTVLYLVRTRDVLPHDMYASARDAALAALQSETDRHEQAMRSINEALS